MTTTAESDGTHAGDPRRRKDAVKVEIAYIDECPNRMAAGDRTRVALDALGLLDTPVAFRLVRSPREAAALRFAGSPTLLLDGLDVFPTDEQAIALACRLYATEAGYAGLPTQGQIEDAIRARLR